VCSGTGNPKKYICTYRLSYFYIYDNIAKESRIYLTGWNERIGGRRVGAGRDLSRVVFPYIPLIFAHSLSPLSSSSRSSRPPSYSRRRRDTETERQISRTFPKCAWIFHLRVYGAHYSAALAVSRAPL